MTVCIKPNLFNLDKIILTDEKEFTLQNEDNKYTFKKINILYKYDFNICKELQILTNYIDVLKYFNKYDKIKFIISDQTIVNLYNMIQNKINNQFNIKKKIINIDNVANVANVANVNSDEIWVCDKKYIELYFINNVSELTLHPSKKSNLLKYNMTKIENSNEITRYFPSINKNFINLNDNMNQKESIHSGKFQLKFEIINYKLKCIIVNGELKYTKSYIHSELKSNNVYKSNIMIEL
jgi:hypothetical protein